jgi:hypothetical protein
MCYLKGMDIARRQRPPAGDLHLDHVAHFVPDLGAAGELLEALGFAPTSISHHQVAGKPAGTSNRCLMLRQGYVEILAPTLNTPNAQRARDLMARYRGVHLVCFGTRSAETEHARLVAHNFSPEPVVRLERKISRDRLLRFNVIYLPPGTMPEGRIQYCEHVTPQYLWDKPSLAHRNGVKALTSVYVVADDPAAAAARWGEYAGLLPRPDGKLVRLDCSRGQIFIGTKEALSAFIDDVPAAPGVAAVGFKFASPDAFRKRLAKVGLKPRKTRHGHSVALPPALGGTWVF